MTKKFKYHTVCFTGPAEVSAYLNDSDFEFKFMTEVMCGPGEDQTNYYTLLMLERFRCDCGNRWRVQDGLTALCSVCGGI